MYNVGVYGDVKTVGRVEPHPLQYRLTYMYIPYTV